MIETAFKKKKVLFIATVAHGHILTFHIPYLKMLKEMGCEVHVATGDEADIPYCDKKYTYTMERNPFSPKNIKGIRELKEIAQKEQYDLIHTHTSLGGILGRLAVKHCRKTGTRIMHTVHGFYFYKGSPLLSWLLYFPFEYYCSKYTDIMITMNSEDYHYALKLFKAKENYFISGVGVDINSILSLSVDKEAKRKEFGIDNEDIIIISVGELIKRKNHETSIRVIKLLIDQGVTNIHLIICGRGVLFLKLQNLISKIHIEKYITLAGFREDVKELMSCSDIFLFPSFSEGLPISLIEAMTAGLPVICSNIRGNADLITDEKGGYLCSVVNTYEYAEKIKKLSCDEALLNKMGSYNKEHALKYELEIVAGEMEKIYIEALA